MLIIDKLITVKNSLNQLGQSDTIDLDIIKNITDVYADLNENPNAFIRSISNEFESLDDILEKTLKLAKTSFKERIKNSDFFKNLKKTKNPISLLSKELTNIYESYRNNENFMDAYNKIHQINDLLENLTHDDSTELRVYSFDENFQFYQNIINKVNYIISILTDKLITNLPVGNNRIAIANKYLLNLKTNLDEIYANLSTFNNQSYKNMDFVLAAVFHSNNEQQQMENFISPLPLYTEELPGTKGALKTMLSNSIIVGNVHLDKIKNIYDVSKGIIDQKFAKENQEGGDMALSNSSWGDTLRNKLFEIKANKTNTDTYINQLNDLYGKIDQINYINKGEDIKSEIQALLELIKSEELQAKKTLMGLNKRRQQTTQGLAPLDEYSNAGPSQFPGSLGD